jgi:hypothetical protein
MNNLSKALCWAGAMLFLALGDRTGWMDHGAVTVMITILPALAWMSISGRMNCSFGREVPRG